MADLISLQQEALEQLHSLNLVDPDARCVPVPGGGGQRRYLRVQDSRPARILCLSPAPQHVGGSLDENQSFVYMARLLEAHGGHGPRLLAHSAPRPDRAAWFLEEDLGDTRLLELALATPHEDGLMDLCLDALAVLVDLQLRLKPPVFDASRTHSPAWGTGMLLAEESGPWRRLLIHDHLRLDLDHAALERECLDLARVTGALPSGEFIHRDFQSTNLLQVNGAWRVVDFQGARLGSPYYDVASLVYDPYLALPPDVRLGLLEEYAEIGHPVHGLELEEMLPDLQRVAAHRLMQAQAAYLRIAKATGERRWLRHLVPAASALRSLCLDGAFADWPVLCDTSWLAWDHLNRLGVEPA